MEREVKIINKLGLHLRAATQLINLASKFDGEITISCNGNTADAQSVMDVLMLAATKGTMVTLAASGETEEDERQIIDEITELINNRFNEGE